MTHQPLERDEVNPVSGTGQGKGSGGMQQVYPVPARKPSGAVVLLPEYAGQVGAAAAAASQHRLYPALEAVGAAALLDSR